MPASHNILVCPVCPRHAEIISAASDQQTTTNRLVCVADIEQKTHAVARKPRDAAAVLFSLKFADNIHDKFKSSQASKARFQSSKHTSAKQNLMQNGHSRSFMESVLETLERR